MLPRVLEMRWHFGLYDVSRAKAVGKPLLLGSRARETTFVHQAQLTTPMATRFDQQRYYPLDFQVFRGARSDARGIEPVRLLQSLTHSIVLRASPTATLDRQSQDAQSAIQCPAGGVDCRSIFEGCLGLREDACQHLGCVCQEGDNILGALLAIAPFTGKAEIADPV